MSASEGLRAEWLDGEFWRKLDQLEERHRRVQNEHESARRTLDGVRPGEAEQMRRAWLCYCEVIARLDETTAELEALRACSG